MHNLETEGERVRTTVRDKECDPKRRARLE